MENKFVFITIMSLMLISFVSATTDSVYVEDYDLEVEYNSAIADDIFSLTLTITNDASTSRNLTLEFEEDDPFEFINDDDWNIEIESEQTVSKTFRIEVDDDADSKKYDLNFNLDDQDDDWDEEFDIRVTTDSVELSLGEIISSPTKILPGSKDVELTVVVKNTGDYSAEDMIVTLVLPEGFTPSNSYSDVVHLGDLDSDESEELIFYFDVDNYLKESKYSAELKLEYQNDGDDEVSNLDLNLPVFSIPQFKIISVETLTDDIYAGETSKIKVSVQNIGGEDGDDVSLKVYERSDQPFTFSEKSSYIGSLDVGQTGYAIFEFDTEKQATEISYLLDFQVRSISGDSVLVDDLTTNINVSSKSFDIKDYVLFLILGFIGLVVLVFVVVRKI